LKKEFEVYPTGSRDFTKLKIKITKAKKKRNSTF